MPLATNPGRGFTFDVIHDRVNQYATTLSVFIKNVF
jgi:hypothetical protein